jgi:hypothetical protein
MPSKADPAFVERVLRLAANMTYGQIAAEISTIHQTITRNQVAGIVYRHGMADPVKVAARKAWLEERAKKIEANAEERRQREASRNREYDERCRALRAAMKAEAERLKAKGISMNVDGYQAERRARLEALKGLEMRRVGLGEISRTTCRWIDGEPRGEHFYCGNETALRSSYCPCHHAVAYNRIAKEAPNPNSFIQKRVTTGAWR